MSNIVANIGLLASQSPFLAYFIIYLATVFFGNISAFTSFWLVFQGYFGEGGVPTLILTLFLADMTGDLLWYSLGRALRDTQFGTWVKQHLPWHEKIEQALRRNGRGWIFLSKFIYAAGFPVVFSIGWTKMEFKRFLRNSVLSALIWLPILLGLAYGLISSLSPLRATSIFKKFELVFFIGLALFIFLDYLLAKVIAGVFNKKFENGEGGNSEENDIVKI